MSDIEEDEHYESDGQETSDDEYDKKKEEHDEDEEEEEEEDPDNWQQFPGNAEAIQMSDEEDDYEVNEEVNENDEEDEDDDEDDEDDDDKSYNYLENKIDTEFKNEFIKSIHPEEFVNSFSEIKSLTQIKKGQNKDSNISNIIIDENHKTYPFLTKYEMTRILGLRISQLNSGARPLVELQNKVIDNHIIAKQELLEKKIPFIIMRPLPNGKKEYWRLQDLAIIER